MADVATFPTDCPACHGQGFFTYDVDMDDPRFGRAFPCSCLQGRSGEETLRLLIGHSGLEEAGLTDKTFAAFRISDSNRQAFLSAQRFAQNPQGWLLLCGGVGRGKTHLLAAIGNEMLARGLPVVYANAPRMLGRLKATFDARNVGELSFEERFQGLKQVNVLLLDDLGAEYATEWAQVTFFELLDHRYSNHLATAIASNLKRSSFDGRLGSRLQEAIYVELSGPDYRQILGRQQQGDLWPTA